MNKKKLILLFIFLISLTGCGSSYTTQINFDNLDLKLKSSKSYISKNIDKTQYPGMLIYQEKQNNTGSQFISSIIITAQDNIGIKTKDFANQNINSLKSSIGSIKIKSTETMSFNCSGNKIIGIIKDFTIIENNKNNYYSQFFFIDNNKGYIISFQSNNQNDNLDFKDSLNNLSCI